MNSKTALTLIDGKDAARILGLHPRTFRRLWKRLGMQPTIPAHADHKWSEPDLFKVVSKWQKTTVQRAKEIYANQSRAA